MDAEVIMESILKRLHFLSGYCRHCGKKKCPGKANGSFLPGTIKTDIVIQAIKEGIADAPSPNRL